MKEKKKILTGPWLGCCYVTLPWNVDDNSITGLGMSLVIVGMQIFWQKIRISLCAFISTIVTMENKFKILFSLINYNLCKLKSITNVRRRKCITCKIAQHQNKQLPEDFFLIQCALVSITITFSAVVGFIYNGQSVCITYY